METDQGIDAALAPYNVEVRNAILQVSQYPQILSQLQSAQSQTVESFQGIVGGFDREKHFPNLYRQFGNYYRSNTAENRVMGSSNRGFTGVANTHFNAQPGGRIGRQASPSRYSPVSTPPAARANRGAATRVHANSYHAQGWSSMGRRGNAVRSSGGGARGGDGRH